MKNKNLRSLLIIILILLFSTGCSSLPYNNQAPVIQSKPLTLTKVEKLYRYDVNALDFENNNLSYSLLNYPEGMTIDSSSGVVNWTPMKQQVGKHEIIINVEDNWRNSTQDFVLEVNDILLSSIEVKPSIMQLAREDSNMLSFNFIEVTANYDDETSKTIPLNENVFKSSDENIVTVGHAGVVSGIHPGSAMVTVSYTENGITKSDSINIIVNELPTGDT